MASAFSGHLLNAFNNAPAHPSTPTIISSGAMSFDARAHGTPGLSLPPIFSPAPTPHALLGFTPLTEDNTTAKHIATLQAKLNKKLGPEFVSQRPGPGGGPKLTYAEGWKIINLANEVFGFNGWSSSIVNIATDFVDYSEESRRFNVGVTAIVRVTLRDGAYHEDVGYGLLENAKSKGGALDKCKKEAITDALKRTLRNFGNLLGNCLYDKSYAQEVVKIRVPPVRVPSSTIFSFKTSMLIARRFQAKLDKNDLYRRPEFEEHMPDAPAPQRQATVPEPSSTRHDEPRIKLEHQAHQPETPITYVPRHLRQEMAAAAQQAQASAHTLATPPHRAPTHSHTRASTSGSGTNDATANRSLVDAPKPSGLTTPIQTVQAPTPPPPRASRDIAACSDAQCPGAQRSADAADQDMDDTAQGEGDEEDEDAFRLSTQDGAFLATVDLGEGDLGRPIDFEEGIGGVGVGVMDALVLELGPDSAGQSPAVVPPQPQPQPQPAAKPPLSTWGSTDPNVSASGGQPRPQPRSGPPITASASTSTSSTSSTRSGPPAQDVKRPHPAMSSMGGFHFTPGMKPPTQQQQASTTHSKACDITMCRPDDVEYAPDGTDERAEA
ncbi:Rad52/22 family double-strand break repair protein-domain-containing protein [Butyriboletus roseoflavus]|nr:Rad52/22 family double-strand break repair protein-domain-containing protein [Butyriboletus roseoflavus]